MLETVESSCQYICVVCAPTNLSLPPCSTLVLNLNGHCFVLFLLKKNLKVNLHQTAGSHPLPMIDGETFKWRRRFFLFTQTDQYEFDCFYSRKYFVSSHNSGL